jgi:hypothetical protein
LNPSDPPLDSEAELRSRAEFIRAQLPSGGLFLGQDWRISPRPFRLDPGVARDLESLGRVLIQFYRAVNLLYRLSAEGKQPGWIASLLDQGKPADLIALQRDPAFKNDLPRVIRPDLLLTRDGMSLIELDSVPGGIGLTDWLNRTYAGVREKFDTGTGSVAGPTDPAGGPALIGGASGMSGGFAGLFGDDAAVHIVVSEEAATYRPEMEWVARACGARFQVRDTSFQAFKPGDAVYRFFELFDVNQVANGRSRSRSAPGRWTSAGRA